MRLRSTVLFNLFLQSLSPHPPRSHDDEDDEDLNKVFDVPGFQQILQPAARSPPEKRRVYDEQDFEGTVPNCRTLVKF